MKPSSPSTSPLLTEKPIESLRTGMEGIHTADETSEEIRQLKARIQTLEQQLLLQRIQNEQLLRLNQFNQQLETMEDIPVEAQLAANVLHQTLHTSLCMVLGYSPASQRLQLLAVAGPDASLIPLGFQHSITRGLIGRAIRSRKTLLRHHQIEEAPFKLIPQIYPSQLVCPLLDNGNLEGVLFLASREDEHFSPQDIPFVEALGMRLTSAWSYQRYRNTLADLVQSAALLTSTLNLEQLMEKIAEIARQSTYANVGVIAVRYEETWRWAHAGSMGGIALSETLQGIVNHVYQTGVAIRIRDIRRDPRTSHLELRDPTLRSMLVSPILRENQPLGVILTIGKKQGVNFNEQDEFLLDLIGTHAAVAIERSFLDEELRSSLMVTQMLHELSMRIAESDDLTAAAQVIALTAYRMFQASACGMVLYGLDGVLEISLQFPSDDTDISHPMEVIQQAMQSRQISTQRVNEWVTLMAFPLQTHRRCYGALWLELMDSSSRNNHYPVDEVRLLINQASIALERSILLTETRRQAKELAQAFDQLERSYDQTLLALMNSLDARDHETERHVLRVRQIALSIAQEMGVSSADQKALERGALLHDIGKIGISDTILHKPDSLNENEWRLMREHPLIGARIIREIPFLGNAIPVIEYHHERWDGSGYPKGLKGEEIPLLARIFSVADVLDALLSDRPYRKRVNIENAIHYIQSQSGKQFDPAVVDALLRCIQKNTLHLTEV